MLVFVGTYTEPILFGTGKVLHGKGEGIYAYRFDAQSGSLRLLATKQATNPSYLAFAPSRRCLYAVNELKSFEGGPTGTVSAYALDPASGSLEFLNRRLSHGTDPCHVVVDRSGLHVFVSNFMSGSICVLPIDRDGALGAPTDFVQHLGSGIDPARQRGPHAHSLTLDAANRFAFVPDLGLDKVMIYRFDAHRGLLDAAPMQWLKAKPGAGPRHLAFHPAGGFAYVVNELDSTVCALSYDALTGELAQLQRISTLPADFAGDSTCADIHVSPAGAFVYASNRGHDSIAIFRVDAASGTLSHVAHEPTQGMTPRSFAVDPAGRFLLVANQDSDSIVAFAIDANSGRLRATGDITHVPTPVCVKFLPDA